MFSDQDSKTSISRFFDIRKILPIIAILFTTLISILLIWQRDVRAVGTFRDAVLSNPGTTGFVRQIIAGLLGFLWIYVAGAVFNLTTRLRLASPERTPTLRSLNIWVACGIQRVDLSLPLLYMGLTAAVVLAGQAIGSVWAGAITPVLSPKILNGTDNITSPVFHSAWFTDQFSEGVGNVEGNICRTSNKIAGFIPACPVPGLQNLILDSARSATSYNGLPRNHSKNDNPSWSYVGRSYGVGSSTGVASLPESYDNLLYYSYHEMGYNVESSCTFNSTSAFNLSLVSRDFQPANKSNVELNVWVASGFLPNSNLDLDSGFISYPIIKSNQTVNSILTWAATSDGSLNYASIAAQGDEYSSFDSIQCKIDFVLTNFSVTVNATSSRIEVIPLHIIPSKAVNDFDANGYLISNVMASLNLLAQTAASPSFETLGKSLNDNWQTYNQSIGFLADPTGSNGTHETYNTSAVFDGNETAIFGAVQDSFNAMLDDIICGFGAAQLYWKAEMESQTDATTTTLPLDSQYSAIRLGQDGYIFATLAINLVILVVAIEEAIRTRNWKGLPLLDYLNLTSMVVASSAGGTEVADACTHKHKKGKSWQGKSGSQEAGEVRVRLVQNREDGTPRIQLAETGSASDVEKEGSSTESNSLIKA